MSKITMVERRVRTRIMTETAIFNIRSGEYHDYKTIYCGGGDHPEPVLLHGRDIPRAPAQRKQQRVQ